MRPGLAPAVILVLPVLVRLPFWLAGMRESPVWQVAQISLPGSWQAFPGLPLAVDPNAGWTTQALGTFAARTWLSGHSPWWDPFSGIGMPMAAEMQSSALFLPYILLLALPAGFVLLGLSLQWTAGFSTLALLRRLGCGETAALTGAVLFMCCASFAWIGPPMALPCAFLATFLLGIERARAAARDGGAGWRTIALAVALSITAGFPETAYLDGLLALLWAVIRLAGARGHRVGFAWRVAAGGVAGLLLAAPALWTFLDFLRGATLGARGTADFSGLALFPDSLVQLLFPYALGFPAGLSQFDPTGHLLTLWGRTGGYLGMGLAVAAVLGVMAPGRDRALRVGIAAWAALLIARNAGVPGSAAVMNAIPAHDQLQTFRYAGASWLMPCCVLAAFAVDGARTPGAVPVALVIGVLAGVTVWLAWPLAASIPHMAGYFAVSMAGGVVSLAAVTAAFAHGRRTLAAGLLVGKSVVLFAATLLCGTIGGRLDTAALAWLAGRPGFQRTATLGPMLPNYGALFGVASVNYSYLPAPAVWADHAAAHLRPGLGVLFTPVDVAPGQPSLAQTVLARRRDYEALGVRYVLAPAGASPFSRSEPPPPLDGAEPLRLEAGDSLSGTLAAGDGEAAPSGLRVMIGTYRGASTGRLTAELCAGAVCAHGGAELAGAADNAPFEIKLDGAPAGAELRWTLRHEGGAAVAIWRWPGPDGLRAHVVAAYPVGADEPAQVYADTAVAVYELPGAAPYASARGCVLDVASRVEMTARCEAASTLVRRELAWPGWRATIDGGAVGVDADGLFQAVALPGGTSHVRFDYRPPGFIAFTVLFALGAVALLPWHRVRRTRAMVAA